MDLDDEELKATRKLNGADRKEKTADEMFEELGYIKKCEHKYEQPDNDGATELILYKDEVKCLEIEFWNDKTISKSCGFDMSYITMQELQAINKKCEEMGWI